MRPASPLRRFPRPPRLAWHHLGRRLRGGLLAAAALVLAPAAHGAEPCPGFVAATATPPQADPVHLQRLREVFQRLAVAAHAVPRLGICPDPRPNAFATPNPPTVSITTGMLAIAGPSPDMLAAVLGHEIGHLQRNHAMQKLVRAHQAGLVAARNGKQAALDFFFSFSREQEMEADDVGTKRLAEAGFNPEGAVQLFERMRQAVGDKSTGYMDSHPGFAERITRLRPRVMNEQYFRNAKTRRDAGDWEGLRHDVAAWLDALPTFGEPWYFKGLIAERLGRAESVADFERAVAYEPELGDAWYRLCLGLYREGHIWESAQCSRRLADPARERFARRAFQGRLVTGGDEAPASDLAVVIAPDGATMLTNDRSLLAGWGLKGETLPPAWRAIRPQRAQASAVPRPPSPPATAPSPTTDFADVRAQCRPPLCRLR